MVSGKGTPLKLSIKEREKLGVLVIYNLGCMQKWIKLINNKEWQDIMKREHKKGLKIQPFH